MNGRALGAAACAAALILWSTPARAQTCDDPSDPTDIPQFVEALVIPPAMPPGGGGGSAGGVTQYVIGARQFAQQVLPASCPATTVWGYGQGGRPATYNFPGYTVEVRSHERVRVRWINELMDGRRDFLPHLLPVDETLHRADPEAQNPGVISQGGGPVPLVVHLHGAHVDSGSDGGPEQWWLPNARNLPGKFLNRGPRYASVIPAPPGAAVYEYDNSQRASTLWYHDHALGITRLNVYAGLAGFWIVRDDVEDALNLPGPAPRHGDPPGTRYYEIPLAIQDRSFDAAGQLWYPSERAFFDGYDGPTAPDSPVPPVWNPEFFGDTIVVNGRTWPHLEVEPRKYRFRFLNGCNARTLILDFAEGAAGPAFVQIGNEGGFLDGLPLHPDFLLLAPAERADVIIDFSGFEGQSFVLRNRGPDEPFKGLAAGQDPANPATTGRVLEFRVGPAVSSPDTSEIPAVLPDVPELIPDAWPRWLTLNEQTFEFGGESYPFAALLGTPGAGPLAFHAPVTEQIAFGDTEPWHLVNLTEDAHPIHLHLVAFQVQGRYAFDAEGFEEARQAFLDGLLPEAPEPEAYVGEPRAVHPWESGYKDTVVANPGEVTVVTARFDRRGEYVWHCHILEHEDNEMMRPFTVE